MPTKPDLSEFYANSRPKKKPCIVGFAREQLTDAERQQLDAAVETDGSLITATAISQWLATRGHKGVSHSAVTAHRKGTCSCG